MNGVVKKCLLTITLLSLLALAVPIIPGAEASGSTAATFDRLEMEASPSIQGRGGNMEVTIIAYIYGGCCYDLYADDIEPDLEVPEGLVVVSGPTPERISKLTALAGGEPTIVNFRYTLRCDISGPYLINGSVETSNCGGREGDLEVHVIDGATINRPSVFPENPTSDKEMVLSFESMYPVGETMVTNATIYSYASDDDIDLSSFKAVNGTLMLDGRSVDDVTGSPTEKDPHEEHLFKGAIPKTSSTYVYYWIMVTDENGDTTTSSVYQVEVEDTQAVERLNMISFIFLFVSLAILVALLYGGQTIMQKGRIKGEDEDRFEVLGPVGRKRFLTMEERGRIKINQDRLMPYIVISLVIVLALAVSIALIISGDAKELIDHFLEGK